MSSEQLQFRYLNDRLASILQWIREANAGGSSPATLKALLNEVQEDINRQRAFYEKEMNTLREQMDDAVSAKNACESEMENQRRCASTYQSRYQDEVKKNEALLYDLNTANKRLIELEQEANEARASAKGPQDKLLQTQDDLGKAVLKYDAANSELAKERAKCKDLQSQLSSSFSKQDFTKRSYDEQLKDSNSRLEKAKRLISDLESQNKALESKNAAMPTILEQMRRKNEEELKSHIENTDYRKKKDMADLKRQLDALSSQVDKLRCENEQLQTDNDDANKWMKAMESRTSELQTQKEALEAQLKAEREKNKKQLQDAEKRLKELQDLVMEKMQESSTSRDIQASLQSELQPYRMLLDEEDGCVGGVSNGLRSRGGSSQAGRSGMYGSRKMSGSYSRSGMGSGTAGKYLATGQGAAASSSNRKMPLRALRTEYMDNYTVKSTSWDSRRKKEMPRVD